MSKLARLSVLASLTGVMVLGAVTLTSTPAEARNGWNKCPSRPCLMPCILEPEPTVLCKAQGGQTVETDFANCCCCGLGTKWRPL